MRLSVFTQHHTPVSALPKDLREQADESANSKGNISMGICRESCKLRSGSGSRMRLEPLRKAGKLGYILILLPPGQ